ncbi:MAG TPA: hypothetical protein VF973_05115 [Myxococcales bacterium]
MQRTAVLLFALAAACGRAEHTPPLNKIPLPKGAALKPYDAANPGTPHPYNMAQLGGKVFVALGNLRPDYSVGGPGFLVGVVPSQGFTDVIDLGGADGRQCQNSGAVRTDGTMLYVTCSGDFSSSSGRALVEVDPATANAPRTRTLAGDEAPSGLAVTANKVWMGLSSSASLISVDRTTFALADGADAAHQAIQLECPHKIYAYVADLLTVGSDLYALCSSDQAGVIFRLDPSTGAVRGQADIGATPTALAATPDGRLAVVCSGDNTLWLATPGQGGTLTAQLAHTYASGTSTLQGVRSSDRYVFTTASGSNTVQKIDVSVSPAKVVAEATTGAGTAPWDLAPLSDDEVVVSDSLSDDLTGLTAVDFKTAPQ